MLKNAIKFFSNKIKLEKALKDNIKIQTLEINPINMSDNNF